MVNIENKKTGAEFYTAWVSISIVSGIAAFIIYVVIAKIYNAVAGDWIIVDGVKHIAEDYLLPYILWPLFGLLYGYLQYVLLRTYFPNMGWWILATAVSLSLMPLVTETGQKLASAISIDLYSVWSGTIQLVLVGGLLGVAQWLILRNHISNAFWWIPASMIGWGLVGISGNMGFAFFILPAVVTGLALYLLLKPSQQTEISE
jgi:hypothetical protein